MIKKILLILLVFLFSVPVLADNIKGWGPTWWGMPKEKILTLYRDEIDNIEGIDSAPLNKTADEEISLKKKTIAGFPITVSFLLKKNILVRTNLIMDKDKNTSTDLKDLKNMLTKKYGAPTSSENSLNGDWRFEQYTWLQDVTTITLIRTSGKISGMSISYSPTPDYSGL
ncbi:MAG: hypothetical protein ACE5EB_07870 [Thermodesulfobacteriota bacterium]